MVEAPLPFYLFFFLIQNDIHHEWFCCQQVTFSKDLSEDFAQQKTAQQIWLRAVRPSHIQQGKTPVV